MLSKKVLEAFNKQINAEMYSSYLYLSMAAHFESVNLHGFATWMHKQAQEEWGHAMKFFKHIVERGGKVSLLAIDAPPTQFDTPVSIFEQVLSHERKVTGMIHDLVELASGEKDHPAGVFLQWFVSEQVEEEASADQALQQLKMIGENKSALFMLDKVLGQRQ